MTTTPDHHTVGVRLPKKLHDLIVAEATAQHRTASNLICFIVASYYMDKRERAAKKPQPTNGHSHKASATV